MCEHEYVFLRTIFLFTVCTRILLPCTFIAYLIVEWPMLYPMFCVVILTFIVGVMTIRVRFKSVTNGDVPIAYYQLMQGQATDSVIKMSRCFNNLFEMPVLFYVVSVLYLLYDEVLNTGGVGIADTLLSLGLAWLFVVARVIQAVVHTTTNNVVHRMLAYWLGCLCVLGLWLNLMYAFSFM